MIPSHPKGVLRISSEGDDKRILSALKFSIPEFFFLGGGEMWQVFFWGGLI